MMPNPPNPPTCRRVTSYPATFFTTRPPARRMRPSPVTTAQPSTWSRTWPKPKRSGPAVAVASTEPMLRSGRPGGSRGSHIPWSARRRRSCSSGVPACTVTTRSAGLTSITWSRARVLTARSAGASGASQVPWPSTRTRQPSVCARWQTWASDSVESGMARGRPSGSRSMPELPSSALRRAWTMSLMGPPSMRFRGATPGRSAPGGPCPGWPARPDRRPGGPSTSRPASRRRR